MRILLAVCISFLMLNLHANTLYPLPTARQEAQFDHLLKELRCLVCQNQNLADSGSDLARDLKLQVYEMVKDGQTDNEIIDYLSRRYGDFILFNPPVKMLTAMLWLGPLLFLLAGFWVFWRSCLKRRKA